MRARFKAKLNLTKAAHGLKCEALWRRGHSRVRINCGRLEELTGNRLEAKIDAERYAIVFDERGARQ